MLSRPSGVLNTKATDGAGIDQVIGQSCHDGTACMRVVALDPSPSTLLIIIVLIWARWQHDEKQFVAADECPASTKS